MFSLWTVLAPALAPALTDGLRGIFARFTGGAGGTPQNVDERIKLMAAETEKLKALAQLDQPVGEPSQLIVDIRAIFRYAVITIVWIITGFAVFTPQVDIAIKGALLDLSGACLSFVIGERMYLNFKK